MFQVGLITRGDLFQPLPLRRRQLRALNAGGLKSQLHLDAALHPRIVLLSSHLFFHLTRTDGHQIPELDRRRVDHR